MGERQRILVLYATQTGNAQDVAERVGREAARRHFKPVVESMHLYDPNELPHERFVVFVVSTTGQGDPPESMRAFWRSLLRKSLGHQWLEATLFAVFGLGDSGYPKYNVTGKKLDRRLLDLGGQPVVPRGLGDDQHPSGFEAGLDPWLASLWIALRQRIPLPPGLEDPRPDETGIGILDPPKYRVIFHDPTAPEAKLAALPERLKRDIVERWVEHGRARAMVDGAGNPFGNASEHNSNSTGFGPPSMPVFAQLLTNSRITSEDHEQDVRHIELELGSSGARYAPGDILTLLPSQNQASIDKFLSRCGLDGDTFVTVEAADSDVCTITHEGEDVEFMSKRTAVPLRTVVETLMDVDSASPRRYFFEVMSHFANAEHEKERLQYFATPEGRDDLYRYNQRERRTILEVLEDFPSVQVPFEWLLQTVPRLQQRSFSISSSPLAHPNEAHLTVAVVEWTTPFKRRRRGLCSSWLASLDPKNGKVFLPVWFTKGAISLPSPSVPLILVGPGTGCAPFRSFIQERVALLNKGEPVAPVLFFFGCRKKSKDFLYEADWSAWSQGHKVLSVEAGGGVFVAFSRDQPEKVYVQHKIIEQGKKVLQMMQSGAAAIYVAGSANKMPGDVLSAFESVIAKETGWPQDSVSKYLRDLERKGRYVVEAWS